MAKFRNLGWKEVQAIPCRTYRRALCSTHWERVGSKVSKASKVSKVLTLLTLLTLTRIHPVVKNPISDASSLVCEASAQLSGLAFLQLEVRGTGFAQDPQ
jgi:phosphatidate phosphatase PAH1